MEEQISTLCKQIVTDNPEIAEQLLQAILKESSVTRALYDAAKTPMQHYQNSPIFSSLVDKKLMTEYPQRFEILLKTHRDKVALIEHEIAAIHLDG